MLKQTGKQIQTIHVALTCSEGLKSGCAISLSFSGLMKLQEQVLVKSSHNLHAERWHWDLLSSTVDQLILIRSVIALYHARVLPECLHMLKEDLVGDRCGVEMGTGTGGEGGQEGTKIVLKVCPLTNVLKGLLTLSIQYMYLNTGRHKQHRHRLCTHLIILVIKRTGETYIPVP